MVTELRNGTYYALLSLRSNGRSIEIDVRPSDGIAVALRMEAPILVRASVFAEAGETRVEQPEERAIEWGPKRVQPEGSRPATPSLTL